jgi:hypothetical protein
MTVGLALVTAHLIADFPFQTDFIAEHKLDSFGVLLGHVMIHVLTMTAMLMIATDVTQGNFVMLVVAIAASHMVIDVRRWVEPKESWENPDAWVWLNDQIMHITAITITVGLVL